MRTTIEGCFLMLFIYKLYFTEERLSSNMFQTSLARVLRGPLQHISGVQKMTFTWVNISYIHRFIYIYIFYHFICVHVSYITFIYVYIFSTNERHFQGMTEANYCLYFFFPKQRNGWLLLLKQIFDSLLSYRETVIHKN